MGKEGRRFLPNLKKLGSPRLNLDEENEKEIINNIIPDIIGGIIKNTK